jgi:hypothetical protein
MSAPPMKTWRHSLMMGLTPLERSDLTFHLTVCERCFSLYIETMRYLLESESAPGKGADLCERRKNDIR